jgi:sarcosine oxidase subunit alpha
LGLQETINGAPALDWVEATLSELAEMPEVRVLSRTTAFHYADHNNLGLAERVTDHLGEAPAHLPRQRLWKVRAGQVILATGAIERPLVFADNDRPGIMLAGAIRSYLNRYAVKAGSEIVLFLNNDGAYGTAVELYEAGLAVTVVDPRLYPDGPLYERAEAAGVPVLSGRLVVGTEGEKRVRGVRVAEFDHAGSTITGESRTIGCDLVAVSGGWNPSVHLYCQSGGKLRWDAERACFRPESSAQRAQACVGAANGSFRLDDCLREGREAGEKAAAAGGHKPAGRRRKQSQAEGFDVAPLHPLWLVPSDAALGHKSKHFVDLQNDVTAADIKLALREGYRSVEHVKRYTTTGMGTDQGKTGNVNALGIVAETLGCELPEVGVTTFRPPYTPTTFGIFAGRDVDDLLDPVRTTPMHAWHETAGAVFEDVGQWKRPWYYPRAGEDMQAAVNREVAAVRQSLGILDASTLGKIDIQGPDAAEFLNRIYTNAWSKLEVGRARYGLMLKEDGMVMDDGVTTRLGETHFLMTTTTGNAASVLALMEDYLQTEWPDLRVFLTSVTEQYATISLAGPHSRDLVAELTDDIELSPNALAHMGYTEGHVAGAPARVFRISFTGELAYEINVPASYGMAVWQAAMTGGAKYGITPYGTETMHVLRAEKGFIIVGQETDGSVNPVDLGMDWILSKKKDFIGKRALSRSDMLKADRKQLVGLLTQDPKTVLPEGAQLVNEVRGKPPMTMVGHVTSSYWSPNLGHSIALALVRGGQARMGDKLYAPLADGRNVACMIVSPVFFDKDGERTRA